MSERINVEEAFNPDLRKQEEEKNQDQRELDLYIENRPYIDERGVARDPSGNEIVPSEYFDNQREISYDNQVTYEKTPLAILVKELAQAEYSKDKTTEGNISDAILERLTERENNNLSSESEKITSDRMWDLVMNAKDRELEKLSKGSSAAEDETSLSEKDDESEKPVSDPTILRVRKSDLNGSIREYIKANNMKMNTRTFEAVKNSMGRKYKKGVTANEAARQWVKAPEDAVLEYSVDPAKIEAESLSVYGKFNKHLKKLISRTVERNFPEDTTDSTAS